MDGFVEDPAETVEALAPEVLELHEEELRMPNRVDVAADELLSPVPLLRHEVGALQHGDVLLHGGEAHRVAASKGGYRVLVAQHEHDDVAPCGIGERVEDAVDPFLFRQTYNHMVVRYPNSASACNVLFPRRVERKHRHWTLTRGCRCAPLVRAVETHRRATGDPMAPIDNGAKPEDATEAFFGELALRGNDPLLARMSGTIRFDLRSERGLEHWYVTVRGGDIAVRHSATDAADGADAVATADKEVLEGMASGRVNAMAAMLRGALHAEGDLALLMAFQRLLPGPPRGANAPVPTGRAGQ